MDVAELVALTKAREHRVLAGKLVRRQLSFPERAIRQWAVEIAKALQPDSGNRAAAAD